MFTTKSSVFATAMIVGLLTACGGGEAPKPAEPAAPVEAAKPVEPAAPAAPAAAADAAAAPGADAAATATAGGPNGEQIYTTYCVACHGADGKGNNGLGGNYAEVLVGRKDEDLIASIKNGKTGKIGVMPPWGGTLNDDQIKAVLGYVKEKYGPKG